MLLYKTSTMSPTEELRSLPTTSISRSTRTISLFAAMHKKSVSNAFKLTPSSGNVTTQTANTEEIKLSVGSQDLEYLKFGPRIEPLKTPIGIIT